MSATYSCHINASIERFGLMIFLKTLSPNSDKSDGISPHCIIT